MTRLEDLQRRSNTRQGAAIAPAVTTRRKRFGTSSAIVAAGLMLLAVGGGMTLAGGAIDAEPLSPFPETMISLGGVPPLRLGTPAPDPHEISRSRIALSRPAPSPRYDFGLSASIPARAYVPRAVPAFSSPPAIPVSDTPYIPQAMAGVSGTASTSPGLVFDQSRPVSGNAAGDAGAARDAAGDDGVARASWIRNRSAVVPQGAIITAVLETPLNSDRPGLARATIARDALGFDGTRVLIPRGSRLIGEFATSTSAGSHRILVSWTRLIRPDGVSIRIGSPSTDPLGGAGIAGRSNSHFFERFGHALLQSVMSVGTNLASTLPVGSGRNVYVGLPGQVLQNGQQLVPYVQRPTIVKVREGTQVAVLVARDLDFSGAPLLP